MKTTIVSVLVLIINNTVLSGNVQQVITYQSTVSVDAEGPLDLVAKVYYDDKRTKAPIAVVMHGYRGTYEVVEEQSSSLRDKGFFAIGVSMRGRECDGVRDDGGVEIYDIYDAVEYVKKNYAAYVDASNVHIVGYSGGGGNTFSALAKFPDYFRLGAASFGISDYGFDPIYGWYLNGAGDPNGVHSVMLRENIGDPISGNPDIMDRYHARASALASKNNPYSEIHIFVDYNETTCPASHSTQYRDKAIAAASYPGEFDNITVHLGGYGLYEDFNHNGIDEPGELQAFPHVYPNADQQLATQGWYLDRLLNGSIPEPVLNNSDELFVAGFVKTKRFEFWLGDGQNAAGDLAYRLSPTEKSFSLAILSNNKSIKTKLTVDISDMKGKRVLVTLNGKQIDAFVGQKVVYITEALIHGGNLVLKESL